MQDEFNSPRATQVTVVRHASCLDAALYYASLGWHVLPVHSWVNDACTCRRECKTPAKHPYTAGGFKDATADEVQIRTWWAKWPAANVGIRTGQVSGLMVLDIDPRNGGDASLLALTHDNPMPTTAHVATGGGGSHFYFSHDRPFRYAAPAPGVEVKADDGYVVAPPSRHSSGRCYTWETQS